MYTPDHIGTPLSASATRVMLLGAGELGKEIAIAFQRLGVEVHAVDSYHDAPAHQVVHEAHVVDLSDPAAILELVRRVQPQLIVPELESVAIQVLLDIEETGIAAVVPSAHATELARDREKIRRLAAEELGLPTSAYAVASSLEELGGAIDKIGLPCVIKPVFGSSGRGQSVVRELSELPAAWEYAFAGARIQADRVIVERLIDFDHEITLPTVRSIDPATGKAATWFCEPIGHVQDAGDLSESWQPINIPPAALDNARSVAARISNALGGRGVFDIELFVAGEDVYFSAVSPRPHDTALVTLVTQRFSEFDLHVRAILGLPIDATLISPGACSVLRAVDEEGPVNYHGLAEALQVPEADVRLFGKPVAYPGRRMGVALATADDVEQARANAAEAARALRLETLN
ncbi:Phosphoribosylglycinamide formyltransferase 2 [Corynebacterium occultum]|uniref:Formate-dependent phosphoribosylglycinamide formyltransferase n=1 Tax=Corynebacterium occultum TaxID=2675219 RepID=A0A6B8W6X6_9CORY|nr:formate-dependent phosphoribosylglycinamide formyltransferase [Corynebacterium occultum]QGU08381.1 Phosphoribosylglycinamide formyltransferase 2 [Corynebacterium occultum]